MQHISKILMSLALALTLFGCLLDEDQTPPMMDDDGELLEFWDEGEHPRAFVERETDPSTSATPQYRSMRNAHSGALMEEALHNPADANLSLPGTAPQAAGTQGCDETTPPDAFSYRIYCYIDNMDNARAATKCYNPSTGAYVTTRYGKVVTVGPSTAYCPTNTEPGDGWPDYSPPG